MPSGPSASNDPMPNQQQQIATIEQPPATITNGTSAQADQQVPGNSTSNSNNPTTPAAIPVVTCDFASDMSTSEAGGDNEHEAYRDTLKVESNAVVDVRTRLTTLTEVPLDTNGNTPTGKSDGKKLTIAANANRNRALSVGVEIDAVSEFEPSSSDSGVVSKCAVVKPLKTRIIEPFFGKKLKFTSKENSHQNGNNKKNNKNHKSKQNVPLTPTTDIQPAPKPKPRDPEKEKRRIARKKEKRATLILGLIMGSFIACWLPFFFLYILTPMCSSCQVPDAFFALAFWLGKLSSSLCHTLLSSN
jgi:octopamine receptor alpha